MPDRVDPPVAPRIPHTMSLHGDVRVDDYFWLREKSDPKVTEYLNAEDAYAREFMKPTEELQKLLYDEMLGRIKETDLSVPYRKRDYWYYGRTEQGKQYGILCRKKGSLEAPEEIVIDQNEMAKGHAYFAIDAYEFSDDGSLLLYSTDTTGFREYTLRARDLRAGRDLGLRVEKVSSAAWAADGKTVFYVTDDAAKRPYRLWRHVLGSKSADVLVYEEQDERLHVGVARTRSEDFVLMTLDSHTQSEVRYLRADTPAAEFTTLIPRSKDLEYDVEHGGDRFYIRINDTGRNFRLVSAPVANPARENWEELVPHRADVMLKGVDVFRSAYVLFEREGGLDGIRIVEHATGASRDVKFPEPAYAISPDANAEYDQPAYRFRYQSMVTPQTVYDADLGTGALTVLKRTEVLGGFDASRYATERLHATAPDGTKVPITIAYRKDRFRKDGSMALHLVGYGSYGYGLPASFSSSRVSLMDRGMIVGIAHVRGGDEMGKPWHDRGRMMEKRNSFTDFIACAEHLIAERYTSQDRLSIEGRSAGGLLMGAVVNMRPDLFKAVLMGVPFVDVINTMLDETLPLTVGEFEEWGNPKIRSEYEVIKSYCPYTNLQAKAYPTILVKTSTEDSQVMYWEPAKYVAKLRTLKTDANPLAFKVNFAAGHGGASGRYDALRETAFDYAFLLREVGLAP